MRNSGVEVLHDGPLVAFHLAIEHTTYRILPTFKILKQHSIHEV
jgi:hypothetical protein